MLALYLSVLDDRNFEEDFTEVYNTYKRLVYHTAYKIMDDSYLAEDVLQEVLLMSHTETAVLKIQRMMSAGSNCAMLLC